MKKNKISWKSLQNLYVFTNPYYEKEKHAIRLILEELPTL